LKKKENNKEETGPEGRDRTWNRKKKKRSKNKKSKKDKKKKGTKGATAVAEKTKGLSMAHNKQGQGGCLEKKVKRQKEREKECQKK